MEFSPSELTTYAGSLVAVLAGGALGVKRLATVWARENVAQKSASGESSYIDRITQELATTKAELVRVVSEKDLLQKELIDTNRKIGYWEAMSNQLTDLKENFARREAELLQESEELKREVRDLKDEVSTLRESLDNSSRINQQQLTLLTSVMSQNAQLLAVVKDNQHKLGPGVDISFLDDTALIDGISKASIGN